MNAYDIIRDYLIKTTGKMCGTIIPTRDNWYMVSVGVYTTMYFQVIENFIVDVQVD